MAMFVKALAVVWGIMGLANFSNIFLTASSDPRIAAMGPGPKFNGSVFLLGSLLMFGIALFMERLKKRAEGDESGSSDSKVDGRLNDLKALRRRGLLSSREYRAKREQIIGDI